MSGKVSLYAVRHLADFLFQAIHSQSGSFFLWGSVKGEWQASGIF